MLERVRQMPAKTLAIGRRDDEDLKRASHHLFGREAEQSGRRAVPGPDATVGREGDDRVRVSVAGHLPLIGGWLWHGGIG